jgi:hypothetical protein
MQRLLNPPDSAYRSETGGLMEALRSLTVEESTYTNPRTLRLFSTYNQFGITTNSTTFPTICH